MNMQAWIKSTTNSKTFASILHEKSILPMMMPPTRVAAGHESDAHKKPLRECSGNGYGGVYAHKPLFPQALRLFPVPPRRPDIPF
jgi:hypothetical protein